MKHNLFTFQNNKLLCWRLGPVNAQRQVHYNRDVRTIAGAGTHKPPVSRGMWAFPYPHYDFFFCFHQWEKHIPKKFSKKYFESVYEKMTDEECAIWHEERGKLLKDVQKRFRPSKFYVDALYSHIFPNGTTDYNKWWYWDNMRDFAKTAAKTLYTTQKFDGQLYLYTFDYTKDHLEIFVP